MNAFPFLCSCFLISLQSASKLYPNMQIFFFFQTETVKKCFLFGVLPLQSKLNKEPPFIYEWIRYLNEKCKFFVCVFFFCRGQQTHDIFWWWSKDMIQCICTLQNARLLYLHVGMCLSARLVCGMWWMLNGECLLQNGKDFNFI